jgi:hypothetical protein
MTIPDPTAIANNLMQIEDTRRKWQEQARDAEGRADASLYRLVSPWPIRLKCPKE